MKLDEIIPEKSIVLDESVGFTIVPVDNNNLALVLANGKEALPLIQTTDYKKINDIFNNIKKFIESTKNEDTHFGYSIQEQKEEDEYNAPINPQLYKPIKNNDIDEVRKLIATGLESDNKRCTPLLMAAEAGNLDIISLLVKTGIFDDGEYHSAVRVAAQNNNIEIIDYFASFDSELDFDEIYWIAIDSQNIKMLEYCLNIQYSPYKNSMLKNFPFILCDAIEKENIEVVRFLLKNGADPNKKDEENRNPLTEANKTNNKEIIKILLDAGAKL